MSEQPIDQRDHPDCPQRESTTVKNFALYLIQTAPRPRKIPGTLLLYPSTTARILIPSLGGTLKKTPLKHCTTRSTRVVSHKKSRVRSNALHVQVRVANTMAEHGNTYPRRATARTTDNSPILKHARPWYSRDPSHARNETTTRMIHERTKRNENKRDKLNRENSWIIAVPRNQW